MTRMVQIEVSGIDQVVLAMEEMQKRSLDLRKFMGAVGMIMIKAVHENFAAEGRPSKWKGWSPLTRKIYEQVAMDSAMQSHKTRAGRERQYQRNLDQLSHNKILQGSGKLRNSIVIGSVTNESVEIGSSLVYARIHQLGGLIVPKRAKRLAVPIGSQGVIKLQQVTMPARPFLVLQEGDMQTIVRIAEDYLARGEIG